MLSAFDLKCFDKMQGTFQVSSRSKTNLHIFNFLGARHRHALTKETLEEKEMEHLRATSSDMTLIFFFLKNSTLTC